MRIRTQLVLAFLVLAVLPLLVLVVYSYQSSISAFRRALTAEAASQADEIEERMARTTAELGRRVSGLGALPWETLSFDAEASADFAARVNAVLGDTAPFVDAVELVPVAPAVPRVAAPSAAAPSTEGEPPAPPPAPRPPLPMVLPLGESVAATVVSALESIDVASLAGAIPDPAERAEVQREIAAAVVEARATLAESRREREAPAPAERPEPAPIVVGGETPTVRSLLSGDFGVPVERQGSTVAILRPRVSAEQLVSEVLGESRGAGDELAFAIAPSGDLHVADEARRDEVEEILADADLPPETAAAPVAASGDDEPGEEELRGSWATDEWLVVTRRDPDTEYVFGIARPMGEPLAEIRRTAVRNLGWGLALIAIALLGVLPLSRALSRQVTAISTAAGRVATGDLTTRVPVTSRGELGELAQSFNRMARDLSEHQGRLLAEERRRREQEVRETVLAAEVERKGRDLEEARQLQLALLPARLPEPPGLRLAVHMRTATEVGGDYYDFHIGDGDRGEDGPLTVAIGDATGHGARAGTMVTAVKALFTTYDGVVGPADFLAAASRAVRRMDLGRMAMALALVRFERAPSERGPSAVAMQVASAGMPPVLVHRRASGEVEEVELSGMPLGGFDGSYRERRVELAAGDRVLLMSDGLPELVGRGGEPMGYATVRRRFAAAATAPSPDETIAALVAAAEEWAGPEAPGDDVTLVLVEVA